MKTVKATLEFKTELTDIEKEFSKLFTDLSYSNDNILTVRYVPNPKYDIEGTFKKVIEYINSFADRAKIRIY